jgi:cytochrome b-561
MMIEMKYGYIQGARAFSILSVIALAAAVLIQIQTCWQHRPVARMGFHILSVAAVSCAFAAAMSFLKLCVPLPSGFHIGFSFAFIVIGLTLVLINSVVFSYATTESGALPNSLVVGVTYGVMIIPLGFTIHWLLNTNPVDAQRGFESTYDPGVNPTNKWKVFNWHPLLMVTAYSTLFSMAAVHFRVLPFSHETNKVIHFVTQSFAVACSSLGIAVAQHFKDHLGYPQFYSTHAWIGIFAYGAFCLQYLSGLVSFLFPKLPAEYRADFKPWHIVFGVAIYFSTNAAIVLGVQDYMDILGSDDTYDRFHYTANAVMVSVIGCVWLVLAHHQFTHHHDTNTKTVNGGYAPLASH